MLGPSSKVRAITFLLEFIILLEGVYFIHFFSFISVIPMSLTNLFFLISKLKDIF